MTNQSKEQLENGLQLEVNVRRGHENHQWVGLRLCTEIPETVCFFPVLLPLHNS